MSVLSLARVIRSEEKVQQIQQLIHRSTRVADEYEIDPERNEGANFQFHDVKRRRTERQQMHGGDCECCRGVSERRLASSSVLDELLC